jgi:hypothetical protein
MKNLSLILLLTVPSISHAMFQKPLDQVTLPELDAEINTILTSMEQKQEDLFKLWEKSCNMQTVAHCLRDKSYNQKDVNAGALYNDVNFAMSDIRRSLAELKYNQKTIEQAHDSVYRTLCKTAGIVCAIHTVEFVKGAKIK